MAEAMQAIDRFAQYLHLPGGFVTNYAENGYTLKKNTSSPLRCFKHSLVAFHQPGEEAIGGALMQKRQQLHKGTLANQLYLEGIFNARCLFPPDPKPLFMLAPETIWDLDGMRYIPCIFSGESWAFGLFPLDLNVAAFYPRCRWVQIEPAGEFGAPAQTC